jgi:peptide/nickel transport system substrate-binding protein
MRAIGIGAVALAAMLAAGPAEARSFAWAFSADVLTLDPHASNNTFTNAFVNNIYEGLTRHNARIEIEPALAERWEIVSPTVWRFHLRRGVTFHDGSPFTADDVVFTWARMNTPGALVRRTIGPVTEVRKLDDHTVEFVTSQPFPVLLSSLTHFFVMSRSWAERNNATTSSNLADRQESPASRAANGTGPFRLRLREADTRTVLEANPAGGTGPRTTSPRSPTSRSGARRRAPPRCSPARSTRPSSCRFRTSRASRPTSGFR